MNLPLVTGTVRVNILQVRSLEDFVPSRVTILKMWKNLLSLLRQGNMHPKVPPLIEALID